MSKFLFTKEKPLRVFEAFAGYGSQAMAHDDLKSLYPDLEYEVVGISEIDKYASKLMRQFMDIVQITEIFPK